MKKAKQLLILSFISVLAIAPCISSCGKDKPKTPNKKEEIDRTKDKEEDGDDKKKNDNFTPSGKYDKERVISNIYLPSDFGSKDEILSAYTKDQRLSQLYSYNSDEKDPTKLVFVAKKPNTTHFTTLTYSLKQESGSPIPKNLVARRTYKAGELIIDTEENPEEKYRVFITKTEDIMKEMHFKVKEKGFHVKANGYVVSGVEPRFEMGCTFLSKRDKSGQEDLFKAVFYYLNDLGTIG